MKALEDLIDEINKYDGLIILFKNEEPPDHVKIILHLQIYTRKKDELRKILKESRALGTSKETLAVIKKKAGSSDPEYFS